MDLESLTKHQTILLALLLSFVTSIATGIVTVTLMDQAPPAVTNTINRVVERTVEVVVPDPEGQTASVITKETTVVVKEEDLVTDAIERGSNYMVRIEQVADEDVYEATALGAVISSNGMMVTDSAYVVAGGKYYARLGNQRFALEVVGQDEDNGIAILSVLMDEENPTEFEHASFANTGELKLGQTLISLGGVSRDLVSMGVISGFGYSDVVVGISENEEGEDVEETVSVLSRIDTNVDDSRLSGGPNFNVFGDMIGMTIKTKSESYIVPSSLIIGFVQELEAASEEAEKESE